jgi:flagellar motor switch protein FliG
MSELGGKEKAAVLILGLDRKAAAEILKQLDDDELRDLRAACEALDGQALASARTVLDEFSTAMREPRAMLKATPRYVSELITAAIGPERARKLSTPKPKERGRLAHIESLEPKLAAGLLEREHPQAVAALLYHLDEAAAGKILKLIPEDRASDIVRRIAALNTVPEEALRDIEETLRATLGEVKGEEEKINGVSKAATLVNFLDTAVATKIVDNIAAADEALGKRVRDARFTIEDVAKADTRGLQLVLREIESDKLLLALKTAANDVRDKFLSCVSSRVADSLRQELAVMGPTRIKDVEAAQKRIIEVALQLQKDGKLMIAGAQGDDLV